MVEINKLNPKISIIMPVYNSAKFLHLAVESIQKQTFKEWELLLVDDGSADESGNLCDEYARSDQRIRVFHQQNQGITKTRNRGIREARADYITFIDDDDEYVLDILEKTYMLAQDYNADIVKFGYRVIEDFSNGAKEIRDNCSERLLVAEKKDLVKLYSDIRKSGYFNMIWNGLYKKELFVDKGFMFDESVIMGYEDWIFNNNIFLVPDTQVILDYIGYIHYQRDQHSTSKKFHPNQIKANLKAAESEYKLVHMIDQENKGDLGWSFRATDYLIDILFLFERKGCNYGYKTKADILRKMYVQDVFSVLVNRKNIASLPKQRKLMVFLFSKKHYFILLKLSSVYYRFILWKKIKSN